MKFLLFSGTNLKYSIIIPTLNEEKLLPTLLDSLNDPYLKAKYDYEIIVSDSESIDKTIDISKSKCDKLLCYETGEIKTIAAGRSKGAKYAAGSILLFINADVRIDIKKFLEAAESRFVNSNYVAMTCKIKSYPELERPVDKTFSSLLNIYFSFINSSGIGMARGECQLIRKDIYDKVGGYKDDIVAGEDFELFTRIRRQGKIFFDSEVVVYESPRRYYKWGYSRILFNWFVNSMSSWIFKKSFVKSWEEIR